MTDGEKKRLARWYFGGLGSAGAACCTHPLDLLKVHLQTQQDGKIGVVRQTMNIIKYVSLDINHDNLSIIYVDMM